MWHAAGEEELRALLGNLEAAIVDTNGPCFFLAVAMALGWCTQQVYNMVADYIASDKGRDSLKTFLEQAFSPSMDPAALLDQTFGTVVGIANAGMQAMSKRVARERGAGVPEPVYNASLEEAFDSIHETVCLRLRHSTTCEPGSNTCSCHQGICKETSDVVWADTYIVDIVKALLKDMRSCNFDLVTSTDPGLSDPVLNDQQRLYDLAMQLQMLVGSLKSRFVVLQHAGFHWALGRIKDGKQAGQYMFRHANCRPFLHGA